MQVDCPIGVQGFLRDCRIELGTVIDCRSPVRESISILLRLACRPIVVSSDGLQSKVLGCPYFLREERGWPSGNNQVRGSLLARGAIGGRHSGRH